MRGSGAAIRHLAGPVSVSRTLTKPDILWHGCPAFQTKVVTASTPACLGPPFQLHQCHRVVSSRIGKEELLVVADDDYSQWNDAIIAATTAECLPEEPVFLAVDADRLAGIAARHRVCSADEARPRFVSAVRNRCVVDGKIDVRSLSGCGGSGRPRGVGFLAFLVLAASERGEAGDDRFYLSLSKLLWPARTTHASNRQDLRMPPGERCEEPLWRTWNDWLLQQGFASTARRGRGPRDKFRMYPISQAILSSAEKVYLAEYVFRPALHGRQLSEYLDQEAFDFWLRQRVKRVPHLWQGITDRVLGRDRVGGHRFPAAFREAFQGECFDLYSVVVTGADPSVSAVGAEARIARPTIAAGLVREAALDGTVEYRLRPSRSRHGRDHSGGRVVINGGAWDLLVSEDPQWFQPLGDPLSNLAPASFNVEDYPGVVSLDLPDRAFWVLAPDPAAPTDQLLVSDRRPDPDERVMVVVGLHGPRAAAVFASMQRLRELDLLDWQATAEALPGWREYRRCRVLISPWPAEAPTGVDPELYLRLAPEASDTIRFESGLRAPNERGAFMEGCLPAISIVTEADPLILRIAPLGNHSPQDCHELLGRRGQPLSLPPDLRPGPYVLQGLAGEPGDDREICQRRLIVRAWRDLAVERLSPGLWTTVAVEPGALRLCGPRSEQALARVDGEAAK